MAIKIRRGLYGDTSPYIFFTGSSSDGNTAASVRNYIITVTAQLDPANSDNVQVKDLYLSEGNGYDTFEVQSTPYTEWVDHEDNTFASATEVVDYINLSISQGVDQVDDLIATPRVGSGSNLYGVGVNNLFTVDGSIDLGVSYYWDETTFPNGVEVSRYDRRKITGIITEVGTYTVAYEVVNPNGITTTSLDIVAF